MNVELLLYILVHYIATIPVTATIKMIISNRIKKSLKKEIPNQKILNGALKYESLDENSIWTTVIPLYNLFEAANLIANQSSIKERCKMIAFEVGEVLERLEPKVKVSKEEKAIKAQNLSILISKNILPDDLEQEIMWVNSTCDKSAVRDEVECDGKLEKIEKITAVNGDIFVDDFDTDQIELETENGSIMISNDLLESNYHYVLNKDSQYEHVIGNATKIDSSDGKCSVKVYSLKK